MDQEKLKAFMDLLFNLPFDEHARVFKQIKESSAARFKEDVDRFAKNSEDSKKNAEELLAFIKSEMAVV